MYKANSGCTVYQASDLTAVYKANTGCTVYQASNLTVVYKANSVQYIRRVLYIFYIRMPVLHLL